MRKLILLFFVISFSIAVGQESKAFAVKISSTPTVCDRFVGYDGFGFLYFIKDDVFHKVKDGQSVEYKNLSLGKISRADIQNPLRIVLFYENFNTLVTLDNQLNETQKVNFSDSRDPIVAAAAGIASQNRFWVYNSLTQQIGLFDYLNNTFTTITPPFSDNIIYYETDFNYFQWVDDKSNRYACDTFGKITTYGKAPKFDSIQFITTDKVLFSSGGELHLYDYKKDKKYTIENIDKSYQSFFCKDQILSIFTKQDIINYKIITP